MRCFLAAMPAGGEAGIARARCVPRFGRDPHLVGGVWGVQRR